MIRIEKEFGFFLNFKSRKMTKPFSIPWSFSLHYIYIVMISVENIYVDSRRGVWNAALALISSTSCISSASNVPFPLSMSVTGSSSDARPKAALFRSQPSTKRDRNATGTSAKLHCLVGLWLLLMIRIYEITAWWGDQKKVSRQNHKCNVLSFPIPPGLRVSPRPIVFPVWCYVSRAV